MKQNIAYLRDNRGKEQDSINIDQFLPSQVSPKNPGKQTHSQNSWSNVPSFLQLPATSWHPNRKTKAGLDSN